MRFASYVRHKYFHYFIDVMLAANAIYLVRVERQILDGSSSTIDLEAESWIKPLSEFFMSVFLIEMIVKLVALGPYGYVSSRANCFDGLVTIACVASVIYTLATPGIEQEALRVALAIQVGRLGRLLGAIKKVRLVVSTFGQMLPAAAKLLQVLFLAMFCFSALGTQLFGGLINYGPQLAILNVTDFGEANYYANNFNDLASGMVVCFELLVVNNWFIIADGFAAVAPVPVARTFFVTIYVFGVLVFLSVVVAFAIDAFNTALEAEKNETKNETAKETATERPSAQDGDRDAFATHSMDMNELSNRQDSLETQTRLQARFRQDLQLRSGSAKARELLARAQISPTRASNSSQPSEVELETTGPLGNPMPTLERERQQQGLPRLAVELQHSIAAGTHKIDDDSTGFFDRGRDFKGVHDAHIYTKQEKSLLSTFESLEYLPPNNRVYREYLSDSTIKRPSQGLRWLAMGLIGLVVGIVGYLLKSIIERIGEWRHSLLFDAECRGNLTSTSTYVCGAIDEGGDEAPPGGTLNTIFPVNAGVAVALVCMASAVVVVVQPAAASSGIPEVIAYLNGTHQRKIFTARTFVVKFISCFLAVSSGMAVGPEGPMIHMGAIIGGGISFMPPTILGFTNPFFGHFRNSKDARDFLTAGAAAGVASAFGAPVGGLLFALEEVASTWSQTLTWQTFFCTMSATTVTLLLSSSLGGFTFSPPFGQFHGGGQRSSIEFYVGEAIDINILLFVPTVFIGLTCGALGALFTFMNLKVARFRRKFIAPYRILRVLEPMINMLFLALVTYGLPLAFTCTDAAHANPDVLAEGRLVRLKCPEGQYNELATLMYATGHHLVLLLFSRHDEVSGVGRMTFSGGSVAIFLVVYFIFACCAAGSAISTGLVVPMLIVGACVGRLYGILSLALIQEAATSPVNCHEVGNRDPSCNFAYVDPGAFALIGAAAFFGGVSRLTIALTVIMVEITNDVRFLLPIMLGVMVAKWVADALTHSLYHAIIEAKCLPFLNPEVSLHGARDGDLERFTVDDLQKTLEQPAIVTLHSGAKETCGSCARTLIATPHGAYPVVDARGSFKGNISRDQLLAVLVQASSGMPPGRAHAGGIPHLELNAAAEAAAADFAFNRCDALEKCMCDQGGLRDQPCDLDPYVNASAFAVRNDFSLHRAYMLFRTMGLRHLVITDVENKVVGVLTRRDLMDFRLHAILHPHGHGHGHELSPSSPSTTQTHGGDLGHDHGGGHGGASKATTEHKASREVSLATSRSMETIVVEDGQQSEPTRPREGPDDPGDAVSMQSSI